MKTSETTGLIDAAVGRIQAKLGAAKKDGSVKVEDTGKGGWTSGFATFEALREAVDPLLIAEQVTLYQGGEPVAPGGERLITRLSHGGEWVQSSYPIVPTRQGAQGFGGGRTFAKRWGLADLLGVRVEQEEAQGYTDERRNTRPATRAKAPSDLAGLLTTIRDSYDTQRLRSAANFARGAHPTGEASVAIEKEIEAWLVDALSRVDGQDALADLRQTVRDVKPRGASVHGALGASERRISGK